MHLTETYSQDPNAHASNIREMLEELVGHLRRDIKKVQEPRFQALLETSAEVLGGLKKAFEDYSAGTEPVWKR